MSDSQTSVQELRDLVESFVSERDWHAFHTPKNLTMALSIEAAELMEHFQWLTPEESRGVAQAPDKLAAVAEELADVVCYCLALANELKVDVAGAMQQKMIKNAVKYPVEQPRGRRE